MNLLKKNFSEIKDIILAGKLPVLLVHQDYKTWVGQLCSFKLDGNHNYINFSCTSLIANSLSIEEIAYSQNGQIIGMFYPNLQ